jgi:hypothetical protein
VGESIFSCHPLRSQSIGCRKVFGLVLSDSSVRPKKDTEDADGFARKLGIKSKVREPGKTKSQFLRSLPTEGMGKLFG